MLVVVILSLFTKGTFLESQNEANVADSQGLIQEQSTDVQSEIATTSKIEIPVVESDIERSENPLTEEGTKEGESQQQTTPIESQLVNQEQEITYTFRKDQYLEQHFEKHGAEFPYDTEEEYLEGANQVINHPDSLHKIEAEDGDDVYYLESTNEFVIVSTDGYIRTYFKPSGGIDYYNRQ